MVYEVLVPQPGIEHSPPALEAQSPNHWAASCSVAGSCLMLCDSLGCSAPGSPVLPYLLQSKLMSWAGKIRWRSERLRTPLISGSPRGSAGKESARNAGDPGSIPGLGRCRRPGFNPWIGKIPWRRERLTTPVFWPGLQRIRHD